MPKQETAQGTIQYSLHSTEKPARQRVILAHGFLRNPQTMRHLAEAFASNGIEIAGIILIQSHQKKHHQTNRAPARP